MIRCTEKACRKTVSRKGRPPLTPHEQGWHWDWRTGWRCPDHVVPPTAAEQG